MSSTSVGAGTISIIIPCYHQGAMLREALASVDQVRNENLLEVIVVDDGPSEVESTTIVSQAQEARYSVVPQPNCGFAAALDTWTRRVNGDSMMLLDRDNRTRAA